MTLNEMEGDWMKERLCPTDSRLRPDIRLMEAGQIDEAAADKTRLEQKQRDARRARKSRKEKEAGPRYTIRLTTWYTWMMVHLQLFLNLDIWRF